MYEGFKQFVNGIHGFRILEATSIVQKFDFSKYQHISDIGGASGTTGCVIAQKCPHATVTILDDIAMKGFAD